ncbi:MAG: MFS transporter [Opitutales bacterium]|nr:MFS transporter [Opitutales bacterium]
MSPGGKIPASFSAPLLAILALHMVCESAVIPILAAALAEPASPEIDMLLGMSEKAHKFAYGMALAAYPIAVFFCAPIIGALSDALGRRAILLACLAGSAAGCAAQSAGAAAASLWIFVLGRIAVGATAGVDGAVQAALVERCETERQKNFYLGASLLAMSVGFIAGPALAAPFIGYGRLGLAAPFAVLAPLFALSGAFLAKGFPKDKKAAAHKKINPLSGLSDIRVFFKIKPARALLAAVSLSQIASGFLGALMPVALMESFGFSIGKVAAFVSVQAVFSGAVFGFIGPKFLEIIPKKSVFKASMFFCVAASCLPFFPQIGDLIWIDTLIAPLGFALSYFTTASILSDSAVQSRRGWVLSVLSGMWGLNMGAGLCACAGALCVSGSFAIILCAAISLAAFIFSLAKTDDFLIEDFR